MWLRCSRSTFSLFVFFCSVSLYQSAMDGRAGYYWLHGHGHTQWTSAVLAQKQDNARLDTWEANSRTSTVMPFELLLYHKLIFALFGFAVCSSCQNRSLFLCIVSSINVINDIHRIHLKWFPIYSLNSLQCVHGEGLIWLFPRTNKINFICVSLRTS